MKSSTRNFPAYLSVGVDTTLNVILPNNYGIFSRVHGAPSIRFYAGVVGDGSDISTVVGTKRSMGVIGVAGNGTSGYNFGVIGQVATSHNGAAVYGTLSGYSSLSGRYAGYFNGDTYVNGNLTATSLSTPSDLRLKTNIEPLDESHDAVNNILKMNPISYNYKPTDVKEEFQGEEVEPDKAQRERQYNTRHYGLSAQELQKIYPDIVYEGQDGYLGVNYVELVPVLICAIQQLQEEINELKGADNAKKTLTLDNETTSVDNTSAINVNILYQNTPNPTKNQTTIRFSIADNTRDASICIMDMQGKMLKNAPISSGMSSITVDGNELGKGMFLYSLIVNGQEVDTKKMIIQNH